jgi:hypothetical protein
MSPATQKFPTMRTPLGLYNPPAEDLNTARWLINGYPARVVVWTSEEWARLPERPTDAQFYPCGVWCALRVD